MNSRPNAVYCPSCKKKAVRTITKYGVRDDCFKCDLHSWAGKPLVSKGTLKARNKAHAAFDPIWRDDKLVSRTKAYRMLREELDLTEDECHMSLMLTHTAIRVLGACERIRARLAERSQDEETQDLEARRAEIREKRRQRGREKGKQGRGTTDTQIQEALRHLSSNPRREPEEVLLEDSQESSQESSDPSEAVNSPQQTFVHPFTEDIDLD